MSESRIKKQPLININLPGYTFLNFSPLKNAGGVAMYVKNDLKFKNEQTFGLYGCELLWLTIQQPNMQKFLTIATIYRHSNKVIDKFIDDFSKCLGKLASEKRTFYILGDININLSESNSSIQANNYINTITSNGAFNIITKPTRVMPISAMLIDHVITNDITHTIVPSIILSDLTDHYPMSCSIKQFKSLKLLSSNVHYYRDRKNFCLEMFCIELNNSLLQLISTNLPLH